MANFVCEVLITEAAAWNRPDERIDRDAGAVVDFWGVVRAIEDGREIEGIEYEAHSAMAEHQLKMIARRGEATISV